MLEMAIVENVQREDLNPIDIALGYERLIDECGLTQEQVSVKVSKSRTAVTNYIRLLRLPPPVQASLRDGSISAGHARALLGLEEQKMQLDLLREVLDKGLSVRQVEEKVKELNAPPTEPTVEDTTEAPSGIPSVEELQIQDFGSRLRSFMSTKVEIKHKSDGNGRIEINYYSKEDLERLLDLILHQNA
jgi:ParB family transcriptional regulator, chromosome partitioning protein